MPAWALGLLRVFSTPMSELVLGGLRHAGNEVEFEDLPPVSQSNPYVRKPKLNKLLRDRRLDQFIFEFTVRQLRGPFA